MMKLLGITFRIGDSELVSSHFCLGDRPLLNGSRASGSRLVCFPRQELIRLQSGASGFMHWLSIDFHLDNDLAFWGNGF